MLPGLDRIYPEKCSLVCKNHFRAGIGELLPRNFATKHCVWEERFEEICQIMEVARKHNVPVAYHMGMLPSGCGGLFHSPRSSFLGA